MQIKKLITRYFDDGKHLCCSIIGLLLILNIVNANPPNVIFNLKIINSSLLNLNIWKYENILFDLRKSIYFDNPVSGDSLILKFNIQSPTIIYFNSYQFYVHPNDTVELFYDMKSRDRDSLVITGKNSAYYNFSYLLKQNSFNENDIFSKTHYDDSTWYEYRENLQTERLRKTNFLRNFVDVNRMTNEFYAYFSKQIKYQSLVDQLMPNYAFGLNVAMRSKTRIPSWYYSNITAIDYPEAVNIPVGLFFIVLYTKYLTDLKTGLSMERFSSTYLTELYEHAENVNFIPARDFLFLYILREYEIFNNHRYLSAYKQIYRKIEQKIYDLNKHKFIDSLYNRYNSINKPFPTEVLNTKLLDIKGNVYQFKDILLKYKSKYIYCDIWASWCAPCINEMPYSIRLQKKFEKRKVAFVYFSLDTEAMKDSWVQKSIAANLTQNQYLILGDFNASLSRYINVGKIPKYFIIDKRGFLLTKDPFAPSNSKLEEMLNSIL